MASYVWTHEMPVETYFDVVVVGGGPAGVAAAISAARNGAKTVLIESLGALGGMSTNGLVSIFDTTCDGTRLITGGIMKEILDRMFDKGLFEDIYSRERFTSLLSQWTPYDAEGLKCLLDDMCAESKVEVMFFNTLVDVVFTSESGKTTVDGIIVYSVEGLRYLKARAYVDATGDGTLCARANFAFEAPMTPECPDAMGATLCAEFGSIDWTRSETFDGRFCVQSEAVALGHVEKMFTYNETMVPGLARNGENTANVNAGHVFHLDPLSARALSDSMSFGRKIAWEYAQCFKKYIPGCEKLKVSATGALMGVRESRRIIGEYVLTIDDFMTRRKFADQIGIYSKSVDIHPYSNDPSEHKRFAEEQTKKYCYGVGDYYGIPYGVIVPKGSQNVWVAGRCASFDRKMHGSMRVQPVAYVMGQAAGTAAAMSVRHNCSAKNVNVNELRTVLSEQGAIID